MDLTPMHKRVIALDVHQAKITACAVSNMMTAEWRLPSATSVPSIATAAPWHSGRWRSGPRLSSWRARGCIGRARLRRWRRWASSPGWSTRGTSRPYPVARPIWPMRNGWPRWRARGCCGRRSSRQWSSASFGWWRQRQKLVGMCSAEKNRLHKVLVDAGIRINVLVTDIHGQSARAMVHGPWSYCFSAFVTDETLGHAAGVIATAP